MTDISYIQQRMSAVLDNELLLSPGALPDAIRACEERIGVLLPRSVREALQVSDGFDLRDGDGSFLRIYAAAEIAGRTLERRQRWRETECWGDLIEIARSDETESTYAVRPSPDGVAESPLFEIWSEGYDEWRSNPPLSISFGTWLRTVADAIATGEHDQVYAKLWLQPPR